MSHVVGYVAAVAEADIGEDPMLQLPGFRIGKSGIERIQDKELRGKAGVSRVEVNAFGRVIRELTRRDGQPGEDVTITAKPSHSTAKALPTKKRRCHDSTACTPR